MKEDSNRRREYTRDRKADDIQDLSRKKEGSKRREEGGKVENKAGTG